MKNSVLNKRKIDVVKRSRQHILALFPSLTKRCQSKRKMTSVNEQTLPLTEAELYAFQKELFKREAEIIARQKAFEENTYDYKYELAELRRELEEIKTESSPQPLTNSQPARENPLTDTQCQEPVAFTVKQALDFVPTFDGYNLTVFRFVRECKRARDVVPLHAEKVLTKLICNKLRGRAYSAIEDKNCCTIADLSRRLRDVLCPFKTVDQYRGELASISQYANEHIIDYISRVKDLRTAIIDTGEWSINLEEVNTLTASSFLRGLIPQIRIEIRIPRQSPLDELFDEAIEAYKMYEHDKLRVREPSRENNRRVHFAEPRYQTPERRDNADNEYRESPRRHHDIPYREPQQQTYDAPFREPNHRKRYDDVSQKYVAPRRDYDVPRRNIPSRDYYSSHEQREQFAKPAFRSYREPRDRFPAEQIKQCVYCKSTGHDIHECRKRQFKLRYESGNGRSLPTHQTPVREAAPIKKTVNALIKECEAGTSASHQ